MTDIPQWVGFVPLVGILVFAFLSIYIGEKKERLGKAGMLYHEPLIQSVTLEQEIFPVPRITGEIIAECARCGESSRVPVNPGYSKISARGCAVGTIWPRYLEFEYGSVKERCRLEEDQRPYHER